MPPKSERDQHQHQHQHQHPNQHPHQHSPQQHHQQQQAYPPRSTPPLLSPGSPAAKRSLPMSSETATPPPAKKQSKWSAEEDALIIELRGRGEKWEDISKKLPGRSAISCRLHYQNYLERRSEWDEERKNRLARLYERFKADMWNMVANEMEVPWRAVEAMHWQLGEQEMARRAGVVPFSLSSVALDAAPKRRSTVAGHARKSSSPTGAAAGPVVSPTAPGPSSESAHGGR